VRRVFGFRTVLEAAFLVAVPVVSHVLGLGAFTIVAASAVAYLLVLLVEAWLWRTRPTLPRIAERGPAVPEPVLPPPVAVAPALPEPEPPLVVEAEPEPPAEPEGVAEDQAEPEPEPEPEPRPLAERVLQAVADPEPEAAPEPEAERAEEPEPAEDAAPVVPIGVPAAPRAWNLWDLERLTRDAAGTDARRDEERTFLLMYLREFAGPDGALPLDFDALVRDSFGDLVGTR
jgi:hypothetical protein